MFVFLSLSLPPFPSLQIQRACPQMMTKKKEPVRNEESNISREECTRKNERLDGAEDWLSHLGDKVAGDTQSEQQKEKQCQNES